MSLIPDPTYLVIGVGLLAVVLGVLWPANSRRWGTERTMPPDPVWEPWEDVPVLEPPENSPVPSYIVGEIIETMVPSPLGRRVVEPSQRPRELGDGR